MGKAAGATTVFSSAWSCFSPLPTYFSPFPICFSTPPILETPLSQLVCRHHQYGTYDHRHRRVRSMAELDLSLSHSCRPEKWSLCYDPSYSTSAGTALAGITKAVKNPRAKERMSANLAARRYYYSDCNYAAKCQQKLNNHFKTQKHLKKVAESSS
jgi:hypothetical protein